jgi:hypothetical protein
VDLSAEWKSVRDALDSKRIMQRTPSGAPLPERAFVEKNALLALKGSWAELQQSRIIAARGSGTQPTVTLQASTKAPAGLETTKTARAVKGAKALLVVGAVVDAVGRANQAVITEDRFARGEITQEVREIEHAKNAGGMAGGWAGALGGGWVAAQAAAPLAAMTGPAAPYVEGAAILAGGVAGYLGGEKAAEALAESAVCAVHSTGTTLAGFTKSAWQSTVRGAKAAGRGISSAAVATWEVTKVAATATGNAVSGAAEVALETTVSVAKTTGRGISRAAVATWEGTTVAAKVTGNAVAGAAEATWDATTNAAGTIGEATAVAWNGTANAATASGRAVARAWNYVWGK